MIPYQIQTTEASKRARDVTVLVASRDIPAHTVLTVEDLTEETVGSSQVTPTLYTALSKLPALHSGTSRYDVPRWHRRASRDVVDSEIASHILKLGQSTLDLAIKVVFPPTCAGCGSLGGWLCDRCAVGLAELDLIGEFEYRPRVDANITLIARYVYADPVRRSIHLLKYQGQRARAAWLAEQIEPLLVLVTQTGSILEPVPLTPSRARARGFNQSGELARHLSALTGVPVGEGLLRIRDTRPQVELNGIERVANVRGAFRADSCMAGQEVILIDDVVTTGSTLRECAAACFRAGASSVVGLAVASGG